MVADHGELDRPEDSTLLLSLARRPRVRSGWTPLRFVGTPEHPLVLAPGLSLPGWARRLGLGTDVRWRIGEAEYRGTGHRLAENGPAYRAALTRFEARFGPNRLSEWFRGQPVCYELGAIRNDDAAPPPSPEAFFDAAARDYDRLVAQNVLDVWLREETVTLLRRTFRPGQRVLELGCGTGLETIPLAETGVEVVAVDISGEMLRHLEDKTIRMGLTSRVHTRKVPASGLQVIVEEFGPASFDGSFSDFGALNLDPAGPAVSAPLSQLVRPGGEVVLGIWNRVCLMELVLYSIGLRPSRALARLRTPVPPGLSRFGLPVTAYSPRSFLSAFAPTFELESLLALPVLLPPYDFLAHVPVPDTILPLLRVADRFVGGRFPFNRLGDHFLARLRRKGG